MSFASLGIPMLLVASYNCSIGTNSVPQEAELVHIDRHDRDVTGIALSAALGFGVGVVGGLLLREFLDDLPTEPVKKAVRRLTVPERDAELEALSEVENAVVPDHAG